MPLHTLRQRGWLSYQTPAAQDAILACGREQTFHTGQSIFLVGDPPGGCYAIVKGQLAVTIAPGERGPSIAHVARPGTWFGEGTYFSRGRRQVGLEAVADSTLFHLPLDAMDRLTSEDPEWTRLFAQILMSNLGLALHALDDLLIEVPSRRIAAVLVRCLGDDQCGELALAQSELGRLSNTSRKVVNSVLATFAERNWIRKAYGRIEVNDIEALRAHANNA